MVNVTRREETVKVIRRVGNNGRDGGEALRLILTLKRYTKAKGVRQEYKESRTATFEMTGVITLDDIMNTLQEAIESDTP